MPAGHLKPSGWSNSCKLQYRFQGNEGLKARNAQRYVRNVGQWWEKPSVRLRRGLNLSLVNEVGALVLSFMSAIRAFGFRAAGRMCSKLNRLHRTTTG
jgi:hypothetical protein